MESIFGFPRHRVARVTKFQPKFLPMLSYRLPLVSEHPCSLEHLSSLYVYSNLAKHQLVGDTEAPLLAIIPILSHDAAGAQRQQGDQQYFAVNPPYYIPVALPALDTIEIELKTDWGAPFPFSNDTIGKVCSRLHFRRRNSGPTRLFL